ncbi:MAG: hypothetical protein V2J19_05520 [Wenzhouxiangella sp.]|jgi:hypothetical protein|nr:hypothetical protein [Wenzhouxiangella sp.]
MNESPKRLDQYLDSLNCEHGPILRDADAKHNAYDSDAAAVIFGHLANSPMTILPRAFVGSAKEGDRDAIGRVAGDFSEWLEFHLADQSDVSTQYRYVMGFILDALWKISEGEEPNNAFNWTGASSGRPGPTLVEKIRRQMIASCVLAVRDRRGLNVNQAVAVVSEENDIPEDQVWSYYKQYKDALQNSAE